MGSHTLLQGIFPTQRANSHLQCLLHCRWSPYPLSHWGSPNVSRIFLLKELFFCHLLIVNCHLKPLCQEKGRGWENRSQRTEKIKLWGKSQHKCRSHAGLCFTALLYKRACFSVSLYIRLLDAPLHTFVKRHSDCFWHLASHLWHLDLLNRSAWGSGWWFYPVV